MNGITNDPIVEEIGALRAAIAKGDLEPSKLLRLATLLFVDPNNDRSEIVELIRLCPVDAPEYPSFLFWSAKVHFHYYMKYDVAKTMLQSALRLDDRRADCLSLLASCEMELDEPPRKYVIFLERAVESERTWIIPRLMLARALIQLGRRREAADHVATAKLYVNSVREPIDPVDRYYECCVTGRLHSNIVELDLLEFRAGKASRA